MEVNILTDMKVFRNDHLNLRKYVGVCINSETFIVTSNEPLEFLDEISIRFPDSLYQSDLSNGLEDFDEGILVTL